VARWLLVDRRARLRGAGGGASAPSWVGVDGGGRPGRGDPRRRALLLGIVGGDHGGGARKRRSGCCRGDSAGARGRRPFDRDGRMVEGGARGAAPGRGARRRAGGRMGWIAGGVREPGAGRGRACPLRSPGAHGRGARGALRPGGGGALFREVGFGCGAPHSPGAAVGRRAGGDRSWPAGLRRWSSAAIRVLPDLPGGRASGHRLVGSEGRLRHEAGALARCSPGGGPAPRGLTLPGFTPPGFSPSGTPGSASLRVRSRSARWRGASGRARR